jgi:hypothetical protein
MKKSRILFGVFALVLLVFPASSKGQAPTCDPGQINTPCSSARAYAQGETGTPPAGALGQVDTPPTGEVPLTEIASFALLSIMSLF